MPPRVVVIGVRDVVFDRHGLGETGQVVDVGLQLLAEVSLVTKGNHQCGTGLQFGQFRLIHGLALQLIVHFAQSGRHTTAVVLVIVDRD